MAYMLSHGLYAMALSSPVAPAFAHSWPLCHTHGLSPHTVPRHPGVYHIYSAFHCALQGALYGALHIDGAPHSALYIAPYGVQPYLDASVLLLVRIGNVEGEKCGQSEPLDLCVTEEGQKHTSKLGVFWIVVSVGKTQLHP